MAYARKLGSVPGHALHEKGLQRQICVGTLLSNQERRAAVVLLVDRWLCSPSGLQGFRLFVLPETRSGGLSTIVWKVRGTVVSWADGPVGVPCCPSPPRPAVRHPDPTRPWYVRVLDSTNVLLFWCNPGRRRGFHFASFLITPAGAIGPTFTSYYRLPKPTPAPFPGLALGPSPVPDMAR